MIRGGLPRSRPLRAGDAPALAQALENLAGLTPTDSDLAQRTANSFLTLKNYSKAADWFRAAVAAEPSRAAYWNTLGYVQAWSGDLAAARASLERYRELEPENPNVLDSLGEVHLHHKRFDEAARYFLECYDANPSFRDGRRHSQSGDGPVPRR